MEIYKPNTKLELGPVSVLDGDGWHTRGKIQCCEKGMIITDLSDEEHDMLLNLKDFADPLGLRGIVVTLYVRGGNTENDPRDINLLVMPPIGSIIRHQDQFYKVTTVLQSTTGSASVYVDRLKAIDLAELHF
jgi:hypothetical protein